MSKKNNTVITLEDLKQFATKADLKANGHEVVELVKDFVQVISDDLKAGYDNLSEKVDGLSAKQEDLTGKIENFAERQDEILDGICKLGEDKRTVKAHQQILVDHETRIVRLESCQVT